MALQVVTLISCKTSANILSRYLETLDLRPFSRRWKMFSPTATFCQRKLQWQKIDDSERTPTLKRFFSPTRWTGYNKFIYIFLKNRSSITMAVLTAKQMTIGTDFKEFMFDAVMETTYSDYIEVWAPVLGTTKKKKN